MRDIARKRRDNVEGLSEGQEAWSNFRMMRDELRSRSTRELKTMIRELNQFKHKSSPSRRITSVEREVGELKVELASRRKKQK